MMNATFSHSGTAEPAMAAEITGLLDRWNHGDDEAFARLMPLVYEPLRRLAQRAIRGERQDHTLQPTALVHEVYLRFANGQPPQLNDRLHFFAVAARLMRRILVDHARGLKAERRGGGVCKVSLEDLSIVPSSEPLVDLLRLDEALSALAAKDARKARVVELRFFGGLSVEEAASVLGVSVPTVILDTRLAKAWLYAALSGG